MFNSVFHNYDSKNNTYTFTADFGSRFKYSLKKLGIGPNRIKYLFINFKTGTFTIHRFFIPDLKIILKALLSVGSVYDVNFKVINKVLDIIDNEIINPEINRIYLDKDVIKREFKFTPLKSQEPAYDAYSKIRAVAGNRGMLLDGAVGVGKTYISLTLAEMLRSEVVLIVAPLPTIQRVWVNSLEGDGCLYKQPRMHYNVGSKDEYKGENFVIAHYENLDKIIPLYKEYNINFTTIIVDEVHNFNEIKSKRTKELMDIVTTIPFEHAIPMSGTPIKARASDLIPLFKIISKYFDSKLERRFQKLYNSPSVMLRDALKEKYMSHTVVLKKSNMDIPPLSTPTIKVKIKNGDRYTLESISKKMKKFIEDRTNELESNFNTYKETYLNYYNKVKKNLLENNIVKEKDFKSYENHIEAIVTAYNKNNLSSIPDRIKEANKFERTYIEPQLHGVDKIKFRDAKTVYKYLSLKVQGEALANIVMRSRIDCYRELAESGIKLTDITNSTVKKTIVFSNYIEVCEAVTLKAKQESLTPITVYGETSKDLTKNVNIFLNNKKVNPLVATYKSLSTGVPLIVANVILIFGLPFRQYIFEQAIGRAWRTGQDLPVTAYIVELDTGELPNITDRDFDIIDFFREEVAKLTGKDDSIVIDKNIELEKELNINGFIEHQDNFISKLVKSTTDLLTEWYR